MPFAAGDKPPALRYTSRPSPIYNSNHNLHAVKISPAKGRFHLAEISPTKGGFHCDNAGALSQNVDNFTFPEKSDTENRDKSPHFEDINTDFECNQTDFKCNQTDFECKNTDFECLYNKV